MIQSQVYSLTFEEWKNKVSGCISLMTYGLTLDDFAHVVTNGKLRDWYVGHGVVNSAAIEILRRDGWGDFINLGRLAWCAGVVP